MNRQNWGDAEFFMAFFLLYTFILGVLAFAVIGIHHLVWWLT